MPSLILESGDSIDIATTEPLTIGRDGSDCNIVFPDESISRHHAKIGVSQDGRYYIGDMRSTNGTFLNGEKLPPQKFFFLEEGDEITLGSVKAKFSKEDFIQQPLNPNSQQNIQNNNELLNSYASEPILDSSPEAFSNQAQATQDEYNPQSEFSQDVAYDYSTNSINTSYDQVHTQQSLQPDPQANDLNQMNYEKIESNSTNESLETANPNSSPSPGINAENVLDKIKDIGKLFNKK